MRSGAISRRPPWVPATAGSESSFWPTADVPNGGRSPKAGRIGPTGVDADGQKRQVNLNVAVSQWPTPNASNVNDGESLETWTARREQLKAQKVNGNGCGTPLAMAVEMWATPTSHERTHTPRAVDHGEQLANQVDLWATPSARPGRSGEASDETLGRNSRPLNEQAVNLWSSPRASDGEKGGPNMSFGAGGTPLPTQAADFPISLPAPGTPTPGGESSPTTPTSRRRLNPAFVCYLMNWPWWWTNVAWTNSGPAAMEWWYSRQRRRLASLLGGPA